MNTCPLHSDTLVPVRGPSGISVSAIGDIHQAQDTGRTYDVLVDGTWVAALATHQDATRYYTVTVETGASVVMETLHSQLVRRTAISEEEVLTAAELETGMLLPFNKIRLDVDNRNNETAGYAVGAFLNNGKFNTGSDGSIEYFPVDEDELPLLADYFDTLAFDARTSTVAGITKLVVSAGGSEPAKWMEQFISLSTLTRRTWNLGPDFMKGVLDGLTDPASGMILCSGAARIAEVQALCTFCGLDYVMERQADSALITVGGLVDDPLEKYQWVPITSISSVGSTATSYCFAVPTSDQLFTLASGLVTHNCKVTA